MVRDGDAVRAWAEEYLGSALAQHRPWVVPETDRAPQAEVERALATHRVVVYRGGNRVGKTRELARVGAGAFLGQLPFVPLPSVRRVWISGLSRVGEIGGVIWPEVKPLLPMGRLTATWYRRAAPEIPDTLIAPGGHRLDFKSAEQGRDKYQGARVDLACVDEEHPASVVEEIRMRLLDSGGRLFVAATPVDRLPWLRELEAEPGTAVITASTYEAAAAGLLDQDAVDAMARALPDRQRAVRMDGDHVELLGAVYPGFSRAEHLVVPGRAQGLAVNSTRSVRVPYPLPATWSRLAGHDFGFGVPAATVIGALSPDGELLVIERVYRREGVRTHVWADQVLGPHRGTPIAADPENADGRAELKAAGHHVVLAVNAVQAGLEAVERWLHGGAAAPRLVLLAHPPGDRSTPRHRLTGRCDAESLARELENYRYPDADRRPGLADPARDRPLKRDDHAADALRYLVATLLERASVSAPPDVSRGRLRPTAPGPRASRPAFGRIGRPRR